MSNTNDGFHWKAFAHVDKYSPDQVAYAHLRLGHEPTGAELAALFAYGPEDGVAEAAGNILVSTGISNLTNLFIAGGGDGFSNAKGIVGVGATSTAAAIGDTALGANGGSAWYQGLDATYPTRSTTTATNDTVTAVATFASGNANFAWAEWCWAVTSTGTITGNATLNSVSSGTETMLNHKIASLGTKASGSSWVFTTTVTFS